MRKGIKILVISAWGDDWDINRVVGSPEIALLIKGFTEQGIKVHLLIPKEKGFTTPNINNLSIHSIPNFRLPQCKLLGPIIRIIHYLILNISFIICGLRVTRLHSFDLIYGLSSLTSLAVYWIGHHLCKPTILKLLGVITLYPIKKILCWLIYLPEVITYKLQFDKLLVLDDGTQGDKVAEYFNVPQNRFLFYQQSIDRKLQARLKPCPLLKKELGFEPSDYIVLFASRLTPLKGCDITLRAMQIIVEKEPRAKLLIVGDGPTRKTDEKLANRLGIWECVKFVGSVKYIDMWKYYGIADIFLSTNTYSNLTLPTIEAMLAGVPVVSLDIRDTNKLVINGVSGFLVEFKQDKLTYKMLADAVCLLLRDTQLRKRMADNAKKIVIEYLTDWDEKISAEINLIKSLV